MFFKSKKVPVSPPDFDRDGFPDYIKKEIFMQPDLIKNFVQSCIKADKINFDFLKIKMEKIKYIYIISTVENYCVALAGAYNFEVLVDIPCTPQLISEFDCANPVLDKSTLVIAVCKDNSQCDRARQRAQRNSAKFVGIFDFSPEDKNAVSINFSGKAKAPTASITLRLVAVTMLSLYLGEKNQVITELYSKISVEKLMYLGEKVKTVLHREYDFRELGGLLKDKNISFTGSNVDFAVSLYASYFFKKVTGNFAPAYPLGAYDEFFDRESVSIFLASNRDFYAMLDGRHTSLVIAPESLEINKNVLGFSESIPLLNPVILLVCIQFMVYYTADGDKLPLTE